MKNSVLLLLIFSSISAAFGQLLLKIGTNNAANLYDFINKSILAGLSLYCVSTAIWIYALSLEKLVNVYVFTALTFALVYLGGVLFLKERLSLGASGGVIFVLIGLYMIVNYSH